MEVLFPDCERRMGKRTSGKISYLKQFTVAAVPFNASTSTNMDT
jgi:hypothetical protein